jgi:hypothetical protein
MVRSSVCNWTPRVKGIVLYVLISALMLDVQQRSCRVWQSFCSCAMSASYVVGWVIPTYHIFVKGSGYPWG